MIAYYITKLNIYSFILNLKDVENYNNTLVTSVILFALFQAVRHTWLLERHYWRRLCLVYRCRCRTH